MSESAPLRVKTTNQKMKSRKEHELRYKLGEETHRIIKRDVLSQSDNKRSVSGFTRKAISSQAPQLAELVRGGLIAQRLVLLLSNIRGINEEIPESIVGASIKDERISKSLTVSITNEAAREFGKFTDETTISTSAAVRCCIFRELYEHDPEYEILDDWMRDEIVRTWSEIRATITEPLQYFHHVLARRFTHQKDITQYFIQQDSKPFLDFAEAYKSDFYQTACYTDLINNHGDHVLTNVENSIEEHTEFSLYPEKREFLSEYEIG
ncbi:hypothetical protein EXE41_17235 [Halorubrum sp. SD690R]|uniref:hypothetical protein n=1 Tax=Halorubrum sp. SD690R TaxID=2518117 RepID=UPI0010F53560|nr:hypothetical protein [Halorubrum sp. SD690R]TKX42457.1 hypothetical protein EXE41_17235 [Halorubrum sp. SD690R]